MKNHIICFWPLKSLWANFNNNIIILNLIHGVREFELRGWFVTQTLWSLKMRSHIAHLLHSGPKVVPLKVSPTNSKIFHLILTIFLNLGKVKHMNHTLELDSWRKVNSLIFFFFFFFLGNLFFQKKEKVFTEKIILLKKKTLNRIWKCVKVNWFFSNQSMWIYKWFFFLQYSHIRRN